jgi:lipopolysaccharide export system permease protein
MPILDRYLLREWLKIFVFTALGFPLVVILFEVTDHLAEHLGRGLTPGTIALAYLFSLPDKLFLVLPAAVLFATIFSLGTMARHSETVAATASGRSFHRMVIPLFTTALVVTAAGVVIGELTPPATRRQLELLGELQRATQSNRHNFVYRAEEGWTYAIRDLNVQDRRARYLFMEREGTGADYPTLAIQATAARYNDSTRVWTLVQGRFRVFTELPGLTFGFDSMRLTGFREAPSQLTVEEKKPEEMRYAELGRYIEALERSGGDGRRLRVGRALKIAVPFTCFIIALFGAPLVMTAPRASGAMGIALSLGTTIVFLTLIQLSRALATGGLIPPTFAAWLPNLVFGAAALGLLKAVRT